MRGKSTRRERATAWSKVMGGSTVDTRSTRRTQPVRNYRHQFSKSTTRVGHATKESGRSVDLVRVLRAEITCVPWYVACSTIPALEGQFPCATRNRVAIV